MKFTKNADVNMTSLQGHVRTRYEDLVRIFGEPDYGPDYDPTDKVSCEWCLRFEDGTVATVYDWKVYGDTPRGLYDWHIGGHDERAVARVLKIMEA